MEDKTSEKTFKYKCVNCDYVCNFAYQMTMHLNKTGHKDCTAVFGSDKIGIDLDATCCEESPEEQDQENNDEIQIQHDDFPESESNKRKEWMKFYENINNTYNYDKFVVSKFIQDQPENKYDNGKPRLDLVPPAIIEGVGEVRTYGIKKYGDSESWKTVEPERYRAAMVRHLCAYLRNPYGVDEESGINHLKHLACNVAFLLEMEREENK